ncbi:unnamed protein product, partial [Candidula unifasciata]
MKQSTLFSVFSKNTSLNGTSSRLDLLDCDNEKAKTNADTLPKTSSKHVDKLHAQAESNLRLDASPTDYCAGNTKVNKLLLLDVELDSTDKKKSIKLDIEDKKKNIELSITDKNAKDENINCKRQGKLSLSSVKRSNTLVNVEYISQPESQIKNQIKSTGKFVTVQTSPLNLHSLIKESQPMEYSDAKLPSDAAKEQGVDSIGYADFLAQLVNKNDKKIHQNKEVSASCTGSESDETKKAVSYLEFLGMFKSPPKVEESTVTIDDDDENGELEKCPLPLPVTEQRKEVKCKSITSFFTKIETKPRHINSSDITTVTVIAEVHSLSDSVEHKRTVKSAHNKKLPGKVDRLKEDKCEIEILSSETITDVEDVGKKVQGTKRNSEASSLSLQVAKKLKVEQESVVNKQKVEQESVSHKQTSNKTVTKSKNEIPSDVSMKTVLKMPTTSKNNNCLHGEDSTSAASLNDAKFKPLMPATIPASSTKSSQSTLHFGTSGLLLKKAEGLKIDICTEEDSAGSDGEILAKKPTEKQSLLRAKLENEEEKKLNMRKANGKEECGRATNGDCSEPVPFVERLLQTPKERTDIGKDLAQEKTEETSTPRRSARLAQSVHVFKDADIVEITSDDDDEPKKRGRKGGAAKSSTNGGSPAGNWPVKSSGKLASIFTAVKSKEPVGKVFLAPVDPEQERLRREFLMSGIPDELKRQIATTAATANLVLDYPPLPNISHVQQISAEDYLPVNIKIPKLCVLDDSFHGTVGMWERLGWKKTQNTKGLDRDPFKTFTANPSGEIPRVDLLLQDLQCCDGKFPFRKTYQHLHSKVVSSETAYNKLTPPIVIDVEAIDDDVIVCDASHVSDLQPLKNTSESKASLWSDLHQPESSEHVIGNTKAMKQLREWLQEWKVVLEKQVRKASKISKNTSKNKHKGGWSDDSDFTDSEEEEETLCNSVLITGARGIGKTASVYALAKELNYKVFEVNSSSLRSGKQLLAQLEEATQSHRVAQNKSKSAGISDTPPAGFKRLEVDKGIRPLPKPKQGTTAAFANLFRLTPQAGDKNSKNTGSKLTVSGKESRSSSVKKNKETPILKITEPVNVRLQRKKNIKSQADGNNGVTSGSLNLTSASLILFDEVDVVFEEDKGFLATVQHFMMSTKIPIVLTSTDASFHLQLQARHDHIRLRKPPLVSAASFLSTICLAHGIRISHQSVLNALHYTKGDIRRCLLNLQYWCESGGGVVQIDQDIDWNSVKSTDNVSEKSVTGSLLAKTFRSRIVSTDDSNDSDFISLRPPRKKAKRMTSDDDSSMDTVTSTEISSICLSHSKKIGTVSIKRKEVKSKNIPSRNQMNVITEDASGRESCQLPLVHTGFEESLLGLHGFDMSLDALMDLIKMLDHAVDTFSVITQALNYDVIYHVALHGLPLPTIDHPPAQLTITAPLEPVASEESSGIKPRKRIIQGDWMDSDSSDADSHLVKHIPQDFSNVNEHSPENSPKQADSGLQDELSANSIPKKRLPGKNTVTNGKNKTESKSKDGSNSLTKSVLAEFSRYYDNLSYIDCMETKSSSATSRSQGVHVFPGLSDDETYSRLSHQTLQDQLQCYTGSMNVLAARQFCSSIGESIRNYKQCSGGHEGFRDSSDATSCNGSDRQAGVYASDWPGELSLPLQNISPDLWSMAEKHQNRNLSSESAFKNVIKCLHPLVQSSDPALCLDYLPYLRDICRSEDGRRLAKTQR